ncbi:MAG: LytTR family transcriptional regulator DNA-binding domain-containing protein [Longibaculum sp.]
MKKELIDKCMQLTSETMERYFHGDVKFVADHLHRNCLWIGARADELYQGKTEIMSVLNKDQPHLPDISLTAQHYFCAVHDTHSCTIAGSYIGVTNPDTGEIFRQMQRLTFVWKEERGELLIIHMHVSNPLDILEEGENFPHAVGRYTKEYLDMLISRHVEKNDVITVKDQKNIHHVINISSILYCESFDRNTIIHTENGDVFGRIQLQEIEQILVSMNPVMFKRVHKSFLINKYYTNSIRRYEVKLRGGCRVPLSQERYIDIYEWLMEREVNDVSEESQ